MALVDFPVSVKPDWGFADSAAANIQRVKFGDGYELRSKAGLNSLAKKWDPTWTNLTKAQADTIYQFILPRLQFEAFLWEHPTELVKYKVVCESVTKSHTEYDNFSISLSLVQDFNP